MVKASQSETIQKIQNPRNLESKSQPSLFAARVFIFDHLAVFRISCLLNVFRQRKNMRLPGKLIQVQSPRLQIVALPIVRGLTE